jgi:hypothetical protein
MAFGNVNKGDEFRVENNGGTAADKQKIVDCWWCDERIPECVLVKDNKGSCNTLARNRANERRQYQDADGVGQLKGKGQEDVYEDGMAGKGRCRNATFAGETDCTDPYSSTTQTTMLGY